MFQSGRRDYSSNRSSPREGGSGVFYRVWAYKGVAQAAEQTHDIE